MIVSISNDVLADPINGHTCQAIEFAFAAAILAKLFQEASSRVKYLENFSHKRTVL